MSKLIERLTQLQHLTPDEIVQRISVPLTRWRRLNTFTRQEYTELCETDIRVTLFNLREQRYIGTTGFDQRQHYQPSYWSYATFNNESSGNAHWYVINNDYATPFQIGIDDVEADRETHPVAEPLSR